MRTTVLSALFVAVTGSFVAASPRDQETTERISYNDNGRRDPSDNPWIELASPTPASHGREFIDVSTSRAYTRLRIDAAAGRPRVLAVRVQFADGKAKTFRVDKTVDTKTPAFVDLGGSRQIDTIVVTSEGSAKAKYAVYGERRSRLTGVATR
ncbi:MAG TPA: hypothetical protein VFQ53_38100 [Kofleriaceae bacterium]|nr:hypothetical protein [Kofleriaceae bacterium]